MKVSTSQNSTPSTLILHLHYNSPKPFLLKKKKDPTWGPRGFNFTWLSRWTRSWGGGRRLWITSGPSSRADLTITVDRTQQLLTVKWYLLDFLMSTVSENPPYKERILESYVTTFQLKKQSLEKSKEITR